MIYAVESEVRKNGLATVVLYSECEDKKNPICKKNQEHEESFLNWISDGMFFQYNGQNLYVVSGRAYQIVAALKNRGYDATCKEQRDIIPKYDLYKRVSLLLGTNVNPVGVFGTGVRQICFSIRDQRYDALRAVEWNIAQFMAFRKAHPRARKVALVTLADTSYISVARIEDTLKRRKELFLTANNPGNIALKHFEMYSVTFTTKKGR